jgi:hypothetical protein
MGVEYHGLKDVDQELFMFFGTFDENLRCGQPHLLSLLGAQSASDVPLVSRS